MIPKCLALRENDARSKGKSHTNGRICESHYAYYNNKDTITIIPYNFTFTSQVAL